MEIVDGNHHYICVAASIVLIVWRERSYKRSLRKAAKKVALDRAWREVLNDPNYMDRRRREEEVFSER